MRCKLCGMQVGRPKYQLDGFSVLACPSCDMVFTDLEPTRDELRQLYSLDYFSQRQEYYFENSVVDPVKGREDAQISDFKRWLELLESRKGKGRLLDVGCGMGIFLKMAQDRGWEAYGVDVSDDAVEIARNRLHVNAYAATLDEAHFADSFFDVVTLLDVIEHLPDPLMDLAAIRKVLKNDGVIFLNTPNERALLRLIAQVFYGISLGKWTYPIRKLFHEYHLYYYSAKTLEIMLRKAGFTIVYQESKSIPLVKARGSRIEKAIVQSVSVFEKLLEMEYELVVIAGRP
jgi:2-polyprenyl-3-methyl-5-hydroxy-6-metoxy-1,4-benzoquinol methylase